MSPKPPSRVQLFTESEPFLLEAGLLLADKLLYNGPRAGPQVSEVGPGPLGNRHGVTPPR